jgi:hypothetical protein
MKKSTVSRYPAANSEIALEHFQNRLSFETDCWDVRKILS